MRFRPLPPGSSAAVTWTVGHVRTAGGGQLAVVHGEGWPLYQSLPSSERGFGDGVTAIASAGARLSRAIRTPGAAGAMVVNGTSVMSWPLPSWAVTLMLNWTNWESPESDGAVVNS